MTGAFVRLTVNTSSGRPLSPSTICASLIDSAAGAEPSSLVIVPTPCASPIVEFADAFDRLTRKVSLPSESVSPLTVIVIVLVLASIRPGVKLSVPLDAE